MVYEFHLPDVGEGLAEAEIVQWHVEPGETVHEDQVVAEVETDKAVVEVPSPVNGTVHEIHAEPGELVNVGDVIISFAVEDDTPAEAADTDTETPDDESADTTPGETRVVAAPSTKRLARELAVDITAVTGSGPGGRVTDADVRQAAEHDTETDDAETPATDHATSSVQSATRKVTDDGDDLGFHRSPDSTADAADRSHTLAAPATRRLADEHGVDIDHVPTDETRDGHPFVTHEQVAQFAEAQQQAQAADAEALAQQSGTMGDVDREDERIPYRGVRRTIGTQMERSKFTAPHVTHHDDVDVTELVATRTRLNASPVANDTKLTYLPFIVKAVVAALKQHPILNAQLDEDNDEIIVRRNYHIGVATATDSGLMVPVVRNADRKGLRQLAAEIADLTAKARNRSISRDEMQGGTFTITNFGAIGGEYATPIINYPEAAILGVGAIKDKPRVVPADSTASSPAETDAPDDKTIAPRKVLTLSLSIDHRVIDGADAAQFVNTLKSYLASPDLLLLE